MKIKGTDIRPRYERHPHNKPVRITTESGDVFQAQSLDVSRSGMALILGGPVMENGQFLEIHAEGLGNLPGRIARTYSGGAALQFEKLLLEDPSPDAIARKLNKLA